MDDSDFCEEREAIRSIYFDEFKMGDDDGSYSVLVKPVEEERAAGGERTASSRGVVELHVRNVSGYPLGAMVRLQLRARSGLASEEIDYLQWLADTRVCNDESRLGQLVVFTAIEFIRDELSRVSVPFCYCDDSVTPILLPIELQLRVLSFLSVRALATACRICKHWNALCRSDESLWRRALARRAHVDRDARAFVRRDRPRSSARHFCAARRALRTRLRTRQYSMVDFGVGSSLGDAYLTAAALCGERALVAVGRSQSSAQSHDVLVVPIGCGGKQRAAATPSVRAQKLKMPSRVNHLAFHERGGALLSACGDAARCYVRVGGDGYQLGRTLRGMEDGTLMRVGERSVFTAHSGGGESVLRCTDLESGVSLVDAAPLIRCGAASVLDMCVFGGADSRLVATHVGGASFYDVRASQPLVGGVGMRGRVASASVDEPSRMVALCTGDKVAIYDNRMLSRPHFERAERLCETDELLSVDFVPHTGDLLLSLRNSLRLFGIERPHAFGELWRHVIEGGARSRFFDSVPTLVSPRHIVVASSYPRHFFAMDFDSDVVEDLRPLGSTDCAVYARTGNNVMPLVKVKPAVVAKHHRAASSSSAGSGGGGGRVACSSSQVIT
jgi:F-box-like/RWD domain